MAGRRIGWIHRLRSDAIGQLLLKPGSRVVDAGCGTGASFSYLLDKVGQSGEVVGVEVNPYLASKARAAVLENGWKNVQVIEAAAQTVSLAGQFDALLLFAVHEILTSAEALDHLFDALGGQARVVSFGAKQSGPPLGWLFNPLFRLASKKWLPYSPPIGRQPWLLLLNRLVEVRVEQRLGGVMYLVSGTKAESEDR